MNVKETARKHIEAEGFDGLYAPGECACERGDLFTCGDGPYAECCYGYKMPCDCGDGCDWHIGPKRAGGG